MQMFRYVVLGILCTCLMIGIYYDHHSLNARVALCTMGFALTFWVYDYLHYVYSRWTFQRRVHSYDDIHECF